MRAARPALLSLAALGGAIAPPIGGASEQPWYIAALAVEQPGELGYWLDIDADCPVDYADLQAELEGVLIRNRIRPLEEETSSAEGFSLTANVYCVDAGREDGSFIVEYDLRFGQLANDTDFVLNQDYGTLAITDNPDNLGFWLRESVKRAVTDYIRANLPPRAAALPDATGFGSGRDGTGDAPAIDPATLPMRL